MIFLPNEENVTRLFSGYIKKVLQNERLKYFQSLKKENSPLIYNESIIQNMADEDPKSLERMKESEMRYLEDFIEDFDLSQAIQSLNDKEKRIIYLRFVEGKKDTVIAKELGVTSQAVSKVRRRILKKLSERLKQDDGV